MIPFPLKKSEHRQAVLKLDGELIALKPPATESLPARPRL